MVLFVCSGSPPLAWRGYEGGGGITLPCACGYQRESLESRLVGQRAIGRDGCGCCTPFHLQHGVVLLLGFPQRGHDASPLIVTATTVGTDIRYDIGDVEDVKIVGKRALWGAAWAPG